jgi:hypothetical protein
MKRTFILFVLFFLGYESGLLAQLPNSHSSIRMWKGRQYVRKFQKYVEQHPSSFLIKMKNSDGDGLGDYLLNTKKTLENAYLHVYFGAKQLSQGGIKQDTALVFIGAKQVRNPSTGAVTLAHDYDNSKIWATSKYQPNCCVPFDTNFDPIDRNYTQGCDINDCVTGIISENDAKSYIHNFQLNDGNDPANPTVIFTTESFLISANDMRDYLSRYPEVEFLQIYIGYNYSLARYDNLTLLFVGVDKNGRHIWNFDEAGNTYMFDECNPCPICLVDYDSKIDDHAQGASTSAQRKAQMK